jgi:hypothetical protein
MRGFFTQRMKLVSPTDRVSQDAAADDQQTFGRRLSS